MPIISQILTLYRQNSNQADQDQNAFKASIAKFLSSFAP